MSLQVPAYEGYGRKLMVEFMCRRCNKTAYRPLKDCIPSDCPVRHLSDLKAPKDWYDGGFYYPLFCPECSEAYEKFLNNEG